MFEVKPLEGTKVWVYDEGRHKRRGTLADLKKGATNGVRVVRGKAKAPRAGVVFYGDSAFASAEGERSQAGLVGGLARKPVS